MSEKYKKISLKIGQLKKAKTSIFVEVGGPGPNVNFSLGKKVDFKISAVDNENYTNYSNTSFVDGNIIVEFPETTTDKPDLLIELSLMATSSTTSLVMVSNPTTDSHSCTTGVCINGSTYTDITGGAMHTFDWDAPSAD